MAFGFPPKFEQSLDLNGLSPERYLAIAREAAEQLEWDIQYISKSGFVAMIGRGIFSTKEEFQVVINGGSALISSKNASGGFLDLGRNKKRVENFLETFDSIQTSLSEKDLEEKTAALKPYFETSGEDELSAPPAAAPVTVRSFLSFFIPREGYYITPIIIDINLLVFILMVLSGVSFFDPGTDNLIAWGANLRSLTLEGQWWRLITNTFLHIGIFHILFNMYALLYIGLLLEPYLGKLRFAAAYLFTGIIASLTSIAVHPLTVSAGASGAIFGMYGVFLAMLTTSIIDKKTRTALLTSIGVFIAYNLMNGMKSGIDNAAHGGGLISGIIIGYAYYPSLKKPDNLNLQYVTVGLLCVFTFAGSFYVYHQIPDDIAKYDKYIADFSKREEIALQIYKVKNAPDSTILSMIKDKGLVNWKANLKILDDADKLNLPVGLTTRIALLRAYCNLRITSYNFIYKAIKENDTVHYKSSIDSCNKQILATLDSLKK